MRKQLRVAEQVNQEIPGALAAHARFAQGTPLKASRPTTVVVNV
jgi:hypothetical protein